MKPNRSSREQRAMTGKPERRNLATEVRVKTSASGEKHIEGYASLYNKPYVIDTWYGEFTETVAAGAFARCLAAKPDIRCLFNHDQNYILGRTKPGTLTVTEDTTGLAYDCNPPGGPMATHVTDAITRGDIDGSSMGFIVRKDSWVEEKDDQGMTVKSTRTILDADLFDVSPVTFPANDSTTAMIRSLWPEGIPAELRSRFKRNHRAADDGCDCDCPECKDNDCAQCSNADCDDADCDGCPNQERSKSRGKGRQHRDTTETCACDCAECKAGNCDDCTNEDCEDENCRCMGRSLSRFTGEQRAALTTLLDSGLRLIVIEARAAKTKKVDGVDLTSDCFAYVGDPDKTSTWKLPIKFPGDDEKTKSHIRNALARFSQTKGIPDDQKDAVWQKIVAAAKAHDIEVSEEKEEDSLKPEDVELRKRRLRQIQVGLEVPGPRLLEA